MSSASSREWKLYLDDMRNCVQKIRSYTANETADSFRANTLINDATLRNLEVLGEAANKIPVEVREKNLQVPWRQIIGTRNKLIHGYSGLDDQIIWDIVSSEIPKLAELLSTIKD